MYINNVYIYNLLILQLFPSNNVRGVGSISLLWENLLRIAQPPLNNKTHSHMICKNMFY